MTHTPHTPGPWTLGKSWDGFLTVTDGTKTICTVGEADIFPGIEADARLIAAAPELLRALKMFVNFEKTIGWVEGECDNWMGDALFHAKQAIAKAEGRGE